MKRKERKFRPDEVMAYKEKMRNYMLHDPMTDEQKRPGIESLITMEGKDEDYQEGNHKRAV